MEVEEWTVAITSSKNRMHAPHNADTSFKLGTDLVENRQLTVHCGETWRSKLIIMDKKGQWVICSESNLSAYFVKEPESCVMQSDGSGFDVDQFKTKDFGWLIWSQ
jgi:hypothetical protein